jgi:hypothetical protein
MIDQGLNITITSGGSGTMTFRYDSLDIAAPLKYAFVNSDRARFGLAAGPVLSIPLSLKGEAEGPGGSENAEIETSGATFGICVGLFGGFQVAVGRVALDIRYLMDFNAVKDGAEDEVFKRRGIFIGLGYEFEF